MQNNTHTSERADILIYETLFYVIIYRSYELLKTVQFWQTLYTSTETVLTEAGSVTRTIDNSRPNDNVVEVSYV